jgi:acyl-CoA thioester hydrolase
LAMSELVEVYRNSVQTWQCDQMGHMNVQFYLDKAASGLDVLAHHLGLGPTFTAREGARLRAREHHIRFQREQHAGAPLCLGAGVLDVSDDLLKAYLELTNPASGEIAATFIVEAELRQEDSGERRSLPGYARDAAKALQVELPAHGAPRGLELYQPRPAPSLEQAESLGMLQTYLGPVLPSMCDADSTLADRSYMGIISDGVPNLLAHTRKKNTASKKVGGAALEYRLVYRARPRVGDILCLRSGIKALGDKAYTLGHWLFDYTSGEAVATTEAVAVMFDLEARKAISIPDSARALLESRIIPGFSV